MFILDKAGARCYDARKLKSRSILSAIKAVTKTAGKSSFREPVAGANRQRRFHMAHPFRAGDPKGSHPVGVSREAA